MDFYYWTLLLSSLLSFSIAASINDLPNEVLDSIIGFLDGCRLDRQSLSKVSPPFQDLVRRRNPRDLEDLRPDLPSHLIIDEQDDARDMMLLNARCWRLRFMVSSNRDNMKWTRPWNLILLVEDIIKYRDWDVSKLALLLYTLPLKHAQEGKMERNKQEYSGYLDVFIRFLVHLNRSFLSEVVGFQSPLAFKMVFQAIGREECAELYVDTLRLNHE